MRKTLNVLAIVITTIVITSLATVAYLHLTNTKVADYPPLVVPKETISALMHCIETDTCLLPRIEVQIAKELMMGVGVKDDHGEILYMIKNDGTLIILVTSYDAGILATIEDMGTGTVMRFTYPDPAGDLLFFKPGDDIFEAQFAMVQLLYFNAMKEASKVIIPPKKTSQTSPKLV